MAVHRKSYSSFARLHENNTITLDQWLSAQEIGLVAEIGNRRSATRNCHLGLKVDAYYSKKDASINRVSFVKLQEAYGIWLKSISEPREMFEEMILSDSNLFSIARAYKFSWPKARKGLLLALDTWAEVKNRVWTDGGEREILSRYGSVNCGELVG